MDVADYKQDKMTALDWAMSRRSHRQWIHRNFGTAIAIDKKADRSLANGRD